MKKSIGSTVSLNIIIVFIVIIFAFIGVSVSYYKAYKVNNTIADSIEKYSGYNSFSEKDINKKLSSLGYERLNANCKKEAVNGHLSGKSSAINNSKYGYCIYYNVVKCIPASEGPYSNNTYMIDNGFAYNMNNKYCVAEYYNYIIKTYLYFNIPILNKVLKFPVYSKTNEMYACYGENCEE